MTSSLLIITAIVFAVIALVLLIALAIRRIILTRHGRRHAEAVRRVRPIAIRLLEEEDFTPPALPAGDQAVLADVLAHYARQVTGAAEGRIADYFRGSDALAHGEAAGVVLAPDLVLTAHALR